MPARKVEVKIVGTNQATGAFQAVITDLDKVDKKAKTTSSSLATFGRGLEGFGRAMSIGVTLPLLAAGGAMTKLAMDAVETQNLFEVAMGDMADAAEEWADNLHRQLGLNTVELKRQVGTWNTMFQAMGLGKKTAYDMSTALSQLAADLSSFYNIPIEEAQERLRAGMVGETEAMRRYGVVLDDTYVKQWALSQGYVREGQELTQQQKVLARYVLILQQTSKAQGDLARTLESPANQLRVLEQRATSFGTKIGGALLGTVAPGIRTMNALLGEAENAWDQMGATGQNALVTLGMLLGAAGPVSIGLGALIAKAGALKGALALAAAGGPWAAAAAVVAAPILGFPGALERAKGLTYEEAQLLSEGNLPLSREQFNAQQAQMRGGAYVQANRAAELTEYGKGLDVAAEMAKAGQQTQNLADKYKQAGIGAEQYAEAMASLDPLNEKMANQTEALRLRLVGLQDAQDGASGAVKDAQEAYRQAGERVSDLSDKLAEAKRRLEDLANPRLTGMGAFEDKIFAIEQKITALDVKRLQLEGRRGTGRQVTAVEKQIDDLQRQRDILRGQMSLRYDPQLRALERLAKPQTEISYAEAAKQIKATSADIKVLEKQLSDAKAEAEKQEERIRALEKANQGYGASLQEAQKQLQLQEQRQQLVNDALAKAYQWLLVDRDQLRGLGQEGVKAADQMDQAVNDLIAATRKQADMDAQAATDFLDKVIKKYEELKRLGIVGLFEQYKVETGRNPADVAAGLAHRQAGGPVWPGQGYFVGEEGPEPFFPAVPGVVLPHRSAGASVSVTIGAGAVQIAGVGGDLASVATGIVEARLQEAASKMRADLWLAASQGAR